MLLRSFVRLTLLFRKPTEMQWSKTVTSNPSTYSDEVKDMKVTLGKQIWEQVLRRFVDLGFTSSQLNKMLLKNPALTGYSNDKLAHSLEILASLGFKTEEIKEMLVNAPQIFDYSKILKSNYLNLLKQVGDHQGRIAALNSPNLLVESPLLTNSKIDYCIMEMGLSKVAIAKSKILQCSYSLIQTRFSFAYRSGFYKKISPKNKEGLVNSLSLSDLFLCTDEAFINQFKGFTIEDYDVFEAMMIQENNLDTPEEQEDSSDDDDEQPPKKYTR